MILVKIVITMIIIIIPLNVFSQKVSSKNIILKKKMTFESRVNIFLKRQYPILKKPDRIFRKASMLSLKEKLQKYGFSKKLLEAYKENELEIVMWKSELKNDITEFITIVINKKNRKLLFYKIIRTTLKKRTKKITYSDYIMKIVINLLNSKFIIKFLASKYCNCDINNFKIREQYYNNYHFYKLKKKFISYNGDFKENNAFEISISDYGTLLSLTWKKFGVRIKTNTNKQK